MMGMMGSSASSVEVYERLVIPAKLAYRCFRRLLEGDRWRLASSGAQPQRMLWAASTGAKNPAYGDFKYVEPLIGPLTINTISEKTISALLDRRIAPQSVTDDVDQAEAVMSRLRELSIDSDSLTDQLRAQGVTKFVQPFDRLLDNLRDRRAALT